jgi:hypothetical protein
VDRQRSTRSRELSLEEIEDAQDLRAVIAAALAATPVDEQSLRRGVWTYVGAAHAVGASAGQIIATLTEIIEASSIAPRSTRDGVVRRVILWCVEAYFGHLGGEGVENDDESAAAPPVTPPMIVSNR